MIGYAGRIGLANALDAGVLSLAHSADRRWRFVVLGDGPYAASLRRRVEEAESVIAGSRILLLQREVPAPTVARALAIAHRHGVLTVLNPAPAASLSRRLLGRVGILVVNETEAELVLGLLAATPDITVEEMRAALATRGHAFGYGTLQRFFIRHRITRKKRARTPASRTARTS